MTEVKIIQDSVNIIGNRITTMLCTYPFIIHAEVLTHRALNRNSASTRAIPSKKILQALRDTPFIPKQFAMNQPGMVAGQPLSVEDQDKARAIWVDAMLDAIKHTEKLHELGVHKQWANRIIAPFSYVQVLLTATDWDNFYGLRVSEYAQPEIKELAEVMLDAYSASYPVTLTDKECHAPLVTESDLYLKECFMGLYPNSSDLMDSHIHFNMLKMKVSANRCKRISYVNIDKTVTLEGELQGFDSLLESGHYSPMEHQAVPFSDMDLRQVNCRSGNLQGFVQFRKMFHKHEFGFNYVTKQPI